MSFHFLFWENLYLDPLLALLATHTWLLQIAIIGFKISQLTIKDSFVLLFLIGSMLTLGVLIGAPAQVTIHIQNQVYLLKIESKKGEINVLNLSLT